MWHNSMVQSPYWRASSCRAVPEFSVLYRTRRFIAVFTKPRHSSLFWASWILCTLSVAKYPARSCGRQFRGDTSSFSVWLCWTPLCHCSLKDRRLVAVSELHCGLDKPCQLAQHELISAACCVAVAVTALCEYSHCLTDGEWNKEHFCGVVFNGFDGFENSKLVNCFNCWIRVTLCFSIYGPETWSISRLGVPAS